MSILINQLIANELNVNIAQVNATVQLLDEGNTVPFVARYRKEMTGGLNDVQLRELENRLTYLRELSDRKQTILKSIAEQNKLTDELAEKINNVTNKTELEDLYLPYKPKRRTRGQIAIESGLAPLAESLWDNPSQNPEVLAATFINPEKNVLEVKSALDGARYILMEKFAEDANLLAIIRNYLWKNGHLVAKVLEDKKEEGIKFSDYFAYQEPIAQIPSHRALALFRGRNEGILTLSIEADPFKASTIKESYCEELIRQHLNVNFNQYPADKWRQSVISWTWRVKILLHMETELMTLLKEKAEIEAINVFAKNIHDLLMAAPAGMKTTMGLDPGLRTGVKVAIVDMTGKLIATETIYPHTGQINKAMETIATLCIKHNVILVAIGNGTASRETERFFQDVTRHYPKVIAKSVVVSEAGASIYSASELATQEFPTIDVALRGAISIARRLQDPLAELVKIDPKSIGVGQYQHDVNQSLLAKKLDNVVEDCVNTVGVDLNTASVPLLTRVAGLSKVIAQNIISWRDEYGRFNNRMQLLKIPRLGPKAFEQCAGFLRIIDGDNPLDKSSVHPEAYPVVNKILKKSNLSLSELMGNSTVLKTIDPNDYTDEQFGLPTVTDILKELEKPGRDPRPEFKTATFAEGIETMEDLKNGMILEGCITNVTNFGAFVDIGVHQDGLVHISSLADKYVDDPHQIVKTGDIVKVKVIDVDLTRKRIALSMRLDEKTNSNTNNKSTPTSTLNKKEKKHVMPAINSVMSDALASALKNKK